MMWLIEGGGSAELSGDTTSSPPPHASITSLGISAVPLLRVH